MRKIIKNIKSKVISTLIILITIVVLSWLSGTQINAQIQVVQLNKSKPSVSREENQNRPGGDYKNFELKPGETCHACIEACLNDPNCQSYTYVKPGIQGKNAVCWLKSTVVAAVSDTNCISGVKFFSNEQPLKEVSLVPLPGQELIWSSQNGPSVRSGINLPGKDYKHFIISADQDQLPFACQKACLEDPQCNSWTFVEPGMQGNRAVCWLKTGVPIPIQQDSCISGIRLLPALKNQKPEQKLGAVDVENFKDALSKFDNRWPVIMDSMVGSFNKLYNQFRAKDIISQTQLYQKYTLQHKNPGSLPVPVQDPAYFMELVNGALSTKVNAKGLKNIPAINGIHVLMTDQFLIDDLKKLKYAKKPCLFDGHYIIIYAKNLGIANNNCGVRIEYDGEINSYHEIEKTVPIHYAYDLEPYGGNWNKSWFNDFIIARVPILSGIPSGKKILSIWKGGEESFLLKQEVDIKLSGPSISYANWSPFDGHLSSNARIWIHGSGFGTSKEGKKIYIESDNEKWELTKNIVWSENTIEVQAPDFPLDTIIGAKLIVQDPNHVKRLADLNIKIGPLMTYVWITGQKFAALQLKDIADKGQPQEITIENKHLNVLSVYHSPGCGNQLTSGNNTDDWYFKSFSWSPNKEIPRYFKFTDFFYFPMDPRISKNWEEQLQDVLNDLIWACSDPLSFAISKGVEALAHLIDPGMGRYDLYIYKKPTAADPSTAIHFNNACSGPYDGLPNRYLISFQLYGPEKYVDQLEH